MSKNSHQFLLKLGNGADPEVFTAFAALTAKSMTLGGEGITTTADDTVSAASVDRVVQTMRTGGVFSMSVSGDFRVTGDAAQKQLAAMKMPGGEAVANWDIVVPGIGSFKGAFHLGEVTFNGSESGGDLTGSLSLSSAGDVVFTEEA